MSMKSLRNRMERATAPATPNITEREMQAFARFKAAKKVQFPTLFPDMTVEDAEVLLAADPRRQEDFETVARAFSKVPTDVAIRSLGAARVHAPNSKPQMEDKQDG